MDAVTAFEHRKEWLRTQLEGAQDEQQVITSAIMALEQTACELAQDEQDEHARQRQQAVMALVRQAPALLGAMIAQGQVVMEPAKEAEGGVMKKIAFGLQAAGVLAMSALAVYEWLSGRSGVALLSALAMVLFIVGTSQQGPVQREHATAKGVLLADVDAMMLKIEQLCQAVDVCVNDLAMLEQPVLGMTRLSGSADDAMLDLLIAQLEAKASGRDEIAMRSLSLAEEYLHMLGMEIVQYSAENEELFDKLPTIGMPRTVRPALCQEGKVIRRGVAACPMTGTEERSVGA